MVEVTVKLTTILQISVNDWLKFAEAKNAVMLAFSGAGITATLTYLSAASNPPISLKIGFLITTFLLCFSSLICAISFLPKTNFEYIVWRQSKPANTLKKLPRDTDNFYYFGYLEKYQPSELLDSLNKLYFENKINTPYKKEYLDIASQITINSEITLLKLKLFTVALYILIFSIFTVPISLLISLIVYRSL